MIPKLAQKSNRATVLSLECQLAQVQIKRFLNGDNIPEELLKDLETHLLHCEDCLAVAKGQKSAVESHMVATPSAAVTARQSKPASNILDVFKQPKTLLLSVALAAVLIAMSTIMRDPTKLFGTKAIANLPAAESTSGTDETSSNGDEKPDAAKSDPETATKTEPPKAAEAEATKSAPDETTKATEPPTPPGPAAAAIEAARDATQSAPTSTATGATGKPTLTKQPIIEANEKSSAPKATTQKATKPAARRTTRTKPAPRKPAQKKTNEVKVYID